MNQVFPLGLSYDDVLLIPQYSEINSRSEVDLTTQITPRIKLKLPLISANMSDVTGVDMAIAIAEMGGLGVIPRFVSVEDQADMIAKVKNKELLVGAAIGCKDETLSRTEILLKAGADLLFLDVAHGHMEKVAETVRKLKKEFPNIDLVAGNIATEEATEFLFAAGADNVKVGVGPGSICTTRIMTGSGVPQITAILAAAKVAKKYNKSLIADGGAKNSGDIVKGLAAGAAAIMAGNLFAGTTESPGDVVKIKGIVYKRYNASTSLTEKKSRGEKNHIEGVESIVPYKGPLAKVVETMTANIRSGLSYSGAKNIKELWEKAKFIQITQMGMRESGAHDVIL